MAMKPEIEQLADATFSPTFIFHRERPHESMKPEIEQLAGATFALIFFSESDPMFSQ